MLQDPTSSASLGMCHLRFEGTIAESHRAAKKLIESARTINIDMKIPRMRFDEDGNSAKRLMKTILERKTTESFPQPRPSERPISARPSDLRPSREHRERSRSRSRTPPRARNITQYNSPTVFFPFGAAMPFSIKPRDLRSCLDCFDYELIHSDNRGIYVIFNSKREAQICYDRRQGVRIPELRITLDLDLFLRGMEKRRSERREYSSDHEMPQDRDGDFYRDKLNHYGESRRDSRDTYADHYRDRDVRQERDRDGRVIQRDRSGRESNRDLPQDDKREKVNPVQEATDHIISELQSLLLKDIKERASAPAIYEYLHPNRFKDIKSESAAPKLGSSKPGATRQNEHSSATTEIAIIDNKSNQPSNIPALPRFRKRQSLDHSATVAKVRPPKLKSVVRPMNHRLNYSSSDNESEESSSLRSTPALGLTDAASALKLEELRKKSNVRDRDFDYTSSEEDEEKSMPVTKRLKLSRQNRIRDDSEDAETQADIIAQPSTPPKSTIKKALPVTPASVKSEVADEPPEPPSIKKISKHIDHQASEAKEEDNVDMSDEIDEGFKSIVWRPADHEPFPEIVSPTFNWNTSDEKPKAVCDDNMDTLLDLDGLQTYIKDQEDWLFMKEVLSSTKPEPIDNALFWVWNKKETKSINNGGQIGPTILDLDVDEKVKWMSSTGASRSQGYFKIPEASKAAYLPHRKKLHQPIDTIQFEGSKDHNAAVLSSRMNRVNNRRLQADISLQKQMLSSETDILRFNQLKKRKKPVKFARSAIHNWGLYAIEPIAANEMIIEYVGEIIRQKVSERREKNYLRSGIGSSYLFRIDEATVIDATKRGGIARFINHCCTPSCTAKIIKVEGQKRIVIYALRDIAADEELTYDYKFEREQNGEERIPCLCGAPGCKGFLN